VVTDEIDHFMANGIMLRSGAALEADVIVTATGLRIQLLGGAQFHVDGRSLNLSQCLTYKGMMFSDVPNLSYSFGYTNASWTLKADLIAAYLCRILNYMRRHGAQIAVPRRDPNVEEAPFLDFTSGYVRRASHILPKQGSVKPWKLHQNYFLDLIALKFGKVDDGTLTFSRKPA
jgi:cation diffusion facilitator CzcD-associated flavoprotein CzcO